MLDRPRKLGRDRTDADIAALPGGGFLSAGNDIYVVGLGDTIGDCNAGNGTTVDVQIQLTGPRTLRSRLHRASL